MIQDIPDVDWVLRDEIQWAYRAIIDLDLTFDALGFPQYLPNFLALMKRYPDMRVVYDHCMKPQIRDQRAGIGASTLWADGMSRLADGHRVTASSLALSQRRMWLALRRPSSPCCPCD